MFSIHNYRKRYDLFFLSFPSALYSPHTPPRFTLSSLFPCEKVKMRNITAMLDNIKCKTICKIDKKTYRVIRCSYSYFYCIQTGRQRLNNPQACHTVDVETKHNLKCDTTGFVHVTYSKVRSLIFTRIDPFAANIIIPIYKEVNGPDQTRIYTILELINLIRIKSTKVGSVSIYALSVPYSGY